MRTIRYILSGNPDSFAFPLSPGIEVAVAPKDNENLNIKTMPYQGCGPMYENLPHHCPLELFKACCSNENQNPSIVGCLQNKLERYEKEMNVKYNISGWYTTSLCHSITLEA